MCMMLSYFPVDYLYLAAAPLNEMNWREKGREQRAEEAEAGRMKREKNNIRVFQLYELPWSNTKIRNDECYRLFTVSCRICSRPTLGYFYFVCLLNTNANLPFAVWYMHVTTIDIKTGMKYKGKTVKFISFNTYNWFDQGK